uniref:Transposon Ty3-I Gag-Pol polyprotein n=1 Tax=Cajanus cajan TaxID=3821 RepID=A0A151S0J1_CAJCA|nr:Transposon Ty3-I Gag-Pol polyprotein [Cajanus cajan]
MPGIDANLIYHRLAIHKEAKPIAQRKRKDGGERREAIITETQKLLNAGFSREVRYTTWLENVVLVKKSSGKWRMCVDYTDLNKACPKDSYPLPSIDMLVDGASGHALLSFLDAYSGYNQIMMYPPNKVHTSFIIDCANYYYRVMPFDLKNTGATYQRLMNKVFHQQLYVDDMVVNTTSAEAHAADLLSWILLAHSEIRQPPEALHHMMSAWPFSQWGMDILGLFPHAKGQLKFLLVAIDYFTKWIKACPLAKITTENVQRFSWRSIVCRFRIPHTLVTDNGRQFIAQGFEDFLHELGIKHLPTSVEHPQTNGQAEAANKVILRELKKRLGNAKRQWADELPSIFWAYHCTPVEVGETSHRRQVFNSEQNARELAADLDLVDELRDEAQIHEEVYKLRASRTYNTRVRPRPFRVGDLVWQLLGEAQKDTSDGKLAPTWGGPFRVTKDLENGAY